MRRKGNLLVTFSDIQVKINLEQNYTKIVDTILEENIFILGEFHKSDLKTKVGDNYINKIKLFDIS